HEAGAPPLDSAEAAKPHLLAESPFRDGPTIKGGAPNQARSAGCGTSPPALAIRMLMSQIVHDPRARTTTRRHRPGSILAQAISAQAQSVASTTAPSTWLQIVARRLTPHEWRRRLVHMTPGLLAATLPLLPHTDPLGWFSQVFLVIVICAMAWYSMSRAKQC